MNAILRSTVLFAQKDFASPEVGAVHTNSNLSPSAGGPAEFSELENYLQVSFSDQRLLRMALTHPSFANEHPEDSTEDNERLEFLGDAVNTTKSAISSEFPNLFIATSFSIIFLTPSSSSLIFLSHTEFLNIIFPGATPLILIPFFANGLDMPRM